MHVLNHAEMLCAELHAELERKRDEQQTWQLLCRDWAKWIGLTLEWDRHGVPRLPFCRMLHALTISNICQLCLLPFLWQHKCAQQPACSASHGKLCARFCHLMRSLLRRAEDRKLHITWRKHVARQPQLQSTFTLTLRGSDADCYYEGGLPSGAIALEWVMHRASVLASAAILKQVVAAQFRDVCM